MAGYKQIYNWDQLPLVLDLQTTAFILGVTETTVKNWLYAGKLTGSKVGRKWLIDRDYIRDIVQGKRGAA